MFYDKALKSAKNLMGLCHADVNRTIQNVNLILIIGLVNEIHLKFIKFWNFIKNLFYCLPQKYLCKVLLGK